MLGLTVDRLPMLQSCRYNEAPETDGEFRFQVSHVVCFFFALSIKLFLPKEKRYFRGAKGDNLRPSTQP